MRCRSPGTPRRPLTGGQEVFAAAWPGFATDTAPLAAAVLLGADAPSRIYDGLFPSRFACAAGFAALGADVQDNGRELNIAGNARLEGTVVTAPDLRGGAALVVAALAARGKTCVLDEGHIRRGYQALPAELASLGARLPHGMTISAALRAPDTAGPLPDRERPRLLSHLQSGEFCDILCICQFAHLHQKPTPECGRIANVDVGFVSFWRSGIEIGGQICYPYNQLYVLSTDSCAHTCP